MFRYLVCFGLLLLLSACSSTSVISPLSPEAAANLRQGKVIVVFFDSTETVNYIIEVYEVLNITQRKMSSSYRDYWSAEELINDLHLREFAKHGLKVRMFSELYSKKDIKKVRLMYNNLQTEKISNPKSTLKLSFEVKKLLSERQIENLVIIDWSGFSLFIKSRGLPAKNVTTTNYAIYDVSSGDLTWNGSITAKLPIDLKGEDGRIYLESNNFAQLKFEIKRLIHSLYNPSKDNIWKLIGLTN